MPIELKFFSQADFDEHLDEILAMCEEVLDVELKELLFEETCAPLGEGENALIACVASELPVTSITNEKVHPLERKLQERFGFLRFQVRSICPECEKNPYDHSGYFPETLHNTLNMCDTCSSKTFLEKEQIKEVTCPVCSKTFTARDHGESYTMGLHFYIRSEPSHKNVAEAEYQIGSMFDATKLCSHQCVQEKLDGIIKELVAIYNRL